MYHNNSNNSDATFVKLSEKIQYFITEFILFCHCGGQKREKIVLLLMRYENEWALNY